VHLVVLQHGLWGKASCTSRLARFLQDNLEPVHRQRSCVVHVVNSTVNEGKLTYDGEGRGGGVRNCRACHGHLTRSPTPTFRTGIDVCGSRVVQLVLGTIQALQYGGAARVVQLSCIGYSLGGLILRCGACVRVGWQTC
jgi:hypothetical protein